MEEGQQVELLEFSGALALIKGGAKVRRQGWNGVQAGLSMFVQAQFPDENSANNQPYIYMVAGESRVPWNPSNLDLFAQDWVMVE